jgi:hypothetical protein
MNVTRPSRPGVATGVGDGDAAADDDAPEGLALLTAVGDGGM